MWSIIYYFATILTLSSRYHSAVNPFKCMRLHSMAQLKGGGGGGCSARAPQVRKMGDVWFLQIRWLFSGTGIGVSNYYWANIFSMVWPLHYFLIIIIYCCLFIHSESNRTNHQYRICSLFHIRILFLMICNNYTLFYFKLKKIVHFFLRLLKWK